ncbi:MAG: M48 family metallopeptidase [Planctomycetales bacterium]|nr:M48 family metallopeptidase [Planctomycetales bacterium]MBN8626646.1 M48 family metallopeptidase [Planctomycetota bacterium]
MSFGYPDQRRPTIGSRLLTRLVIVVVLAAIPLGSLLLKGCQKGPFGRNQVVALNPEQEEQLGLQAFEEVLQQERQKVLTRGPLVDAIRDIAQRLTTAARHEGFLTGVQLPEQEMQWDVRVIDSKEQNAFCLPGGKIVVYTGILPIAESNTGLAVVMGHEIAHALAHHGAERMAQQQMAQIGVMAAGGALGDMDPGARQQVLQMINAGAKFGILKYSRNHESEADRMGLLLMAAAGYDPRESMKFWERMQANSGGKSPPEFASTHPSHETRIQDLKSWIPDAMPLYEASQKVQTKPLPSADFRGI